MIPYENNLMHGTLIEYNQRGKVVKEIEYQNGEVVKKESEEN